MIYYQTENGTLHQGDVLEVLKTLPSESVHMVVTSPPYWGLRDYGIKGQIGLEKTPDEYISKMVIIFKEVKRVLRKDGTLWLNIGDSYSSTGKNRSEKQATAKSTLRNPSHNQASILRQQNKAVDGFKLKDMIGIPWRLAFALQADDWYLRQDIIWHKPNPMPESVTDRCTKAHEYIFLLAKSKKYFFDAEAIKEKSITKDIRKPYAPGQVDYRGNGHDRGGGKSRIEAHGKWSSQDKQSSGKRLTDRIAAARIAGANHDSPFGSNRNRRSVWTMPTQSFPEAHFATFPEELPKICILAGTSQKGCCPQCGRPWVRIVEKIGGTIGKGWVDHKEDLTKGMSAVRGRLLNEKNANGEFYNVKTIGWAIDPECKCRILNADPCVVLDPFGGAGTTGLVAEKLGRKWILIELSSDYCEIAKKRIEPWTKQLKFKL